MFVPVVSVRKVRMPVSHRLVAVPMAVFSTRKHRIGVRVLMMLVVRMFVLVIKYFVNMFVLMALGQVHPHAERH